jgi:hypothetical protein
MGEEMEERIEVLLVELAGLSNKMSRAKRGHIHDCPRNGKAKCPAQIPHEAVQKSANINTGVERGTDFRVPVTTAISPDATPAWIAMRDG